MSGGVKKRRLGNFGMSTCWKCACAYAFSVLFWSFSCFLSSYPFHWSPLMPPTTDDTVWQLLGTNTHTHTASYGIIPRCLILKVPLGSWQLSLIYLLKLTSRVKKMAVCESEFVFMHVCCQSHISYTYTVLTGVLEVAPVYTQKQPQRLYWDYNMSTKCQPLQTFFLIFLFLVLSINRRIIELHTLVFCHFHEHSFSPR